MKAIYSSLAMAALAFAACDDDSFNDWSVPQTNPDSTEDQRVAVTFAAEAAPAVDFANLDEDVDTLVHVFTPELRHRERGKAARRF